MSEQPKAASMPCIVTPEEAQDWIAHGAYDSPYVREVDRLAHTVATEPDRTRAVVVKALRNASRAWSGPFSDSLRKRADAIENGAPL